jgi:hypothetical protein
MFKILKPRLKPASTVWRQGDVFIITVPSLPVDGRVERRPILAEGEATGHTHRLEDPASGRVFSVGANLYLEVLAETATIVHDEHRPVTLPRGRYEARIQREYSPQEIRRVVD